MKRFVAIGVVLAMMLAFAAPAMAQTAVAGDVQIQDQAASQTVVVSGSQINTGSATAVSGDFGSASSASVSQSLTISVGAEQNALQAGDGIWIWFLWW
ncbi:hypothetical protein RxyAA322_17330 [Rubrobacter xylanophilus]|uniref:Uncharacterized protein n=1 Tax=Rubrobacter xylanophilus TaxID=49319 RepID=A0A510HIS2_9ACTN|nr:hypothetical protein [Rubrobacter xylanophilus]BBL79879.1 hypothetical protein RxyAA322_17330 [Rubrobacter xylanophilus]